MVTLVWQLFRRGQPLTPQHLSHSQPQPSASLPKSIIVVWVTLQTSLRRLMATLPLSNAVRSFLLIRLPTPSPPAPALPLFITTPMAIFHERCNTPATGSRPSAF